MYGCTVKKHFYELQNNIDEIYRLFIQIHLKYDVCLAVQLHITKYSIGIIDSTHVKNLKAVNIIFYFYTHKVFFYILILLKPGPGHLLFPISFTLGYYVGRFFKQSGE